MSKFCTVPSRPCGSTSCREGKEAAESKGGEGYIPAPGILRGMSHEYLSPHVELEDSLGDGAALEGLVNTLLLGEVARRRHRGEVHRLEDLPVKDPCSLALERQSQLCVNGTGKQQKRNETTNRCKPSAYARRTVLATKPYCYTRVYVVL